jgi:hypothetical protein
MNYLNLIRYCQSPKRFDVRNVGIYGLLLLFCILLPGCGAKSRESTASANKPIVSEINEHHQIAVEFYGELIGADTQPPDHLVVDSILIRDLKTMRAERFVPEDSVSLHNSFGYFTNVWSPDWAYLALPLGRFHGFALFSSKTLMEDLKQGHFPETIQIRSANKRSTRLWHEFVGWQDPHDFQFTAGLSGKQVGFVFNPGTGETHTQVPDVNAYEAITNSGVSPLKQR